MMSNQRIPKIYYINGNFSVYSREDTSSLRAKRIVGQLTGCCPKNPYQIVTSSYPYTLNYYAISVILEHNMASFRRLKIRDGLLVEENKLRFNEKLDQTKRVAKVEFIKKRKNELMKRNIVITEQRIGNFDSNKIQFEVPNEPDGQLFESTVMDKSEIEAILQRDCNKVEDMKFIVYQDLYQKGFYLSSGMKFGSDFLAYFGDPMMYHAQYAVRSYSSLQGSIEISDFDYRELNALNRLCHAANKIALLAAVYKDCNQSTRIKYWSLKSREILQPDSDGAAFELVDPMKFTSRLVNSGMKKYPTSTNKLSHL